MTGAKVVLYALAEHGMILIQYGNINLFGTEITAQCFGLRDAHYENEDQKNTGKNKYLSKMFLCNFKKYVKYLHSGTS